MFRFLFGRSSKVKGLRTLQTDVEKKVKKENGSSSLTPEEKEQIREILQDICNFDVEKKISDKKTEEYEGMMAMIRWKTKMESCSSNSDWQYYSYRTNVFRYWAKINGKKTLFSDAEAYTYVIMEKYIFDIIDKIKKQKEIIDVMNEIGKRCSKKTKKAFHKN